MKAALLLVLGLLSLPIVASVVSADSSAYYTVTVLSSGFTAKNVSGLGVNDQNPLGTGVTITFDNGTKVSHSLYDGVALPVQIPNGHYANFSFGTVRVTGRSYFNYPYATPANCIGCTNRPNDLGEFYWYNIAPVAATPNSIYAQWLKTGVPSIKVTGPETVGVTYAVFMTQQLYVEGLPSGTSIQVNATDQQTNQTKTFQVQAGSWMSGAQIQSKDDAMTNQTSSGLTVVGWWGSKFFIQGHTYIYTVPDWVNASGGLYYCTASSIGIDGPARVSFDYYKGGP